MNGRVKRLKSFMNAYTKGFIGDFDIPFTPTLIVSAFLNKEYCDLKDVSVFQARLEAREYFDKIRKWNRQHGYPSLVNPDPKLLLIKEMAIVEC